MEKAVIQNLLNYIKNVTSKSAKLKNVKLKKKKIPVNWVLKEKVFGNIRQKMRLFQLIVCLFFYFQKLCEVCKLSNATNHVAINMATP